MLVRTRATRTLLVGVPTYKDTLGNTVDGF
jgi:hypothetical protein